MADEESIFPNQSNHFVKSDPSTSYQKKTINIDGDNNNGNSTNGSFVS